MKICFVTGSRADYGLMGHLMKYFKKDINCNLQVIVTGSHLSKKQGFTYKEILKDKFKINKRINLQLDKEKTENISLAMSKALKNFNNVFKNLKPDLLVLLGDRYEIFCAATAAHINNLKICHLHGGELTRGSLDDAFRHSITKMSDYHFVSNIKYAKRIKQLGEDPKKIFNVGGFGVDIIKKISLLNKSKIERKLKIKLGKKNILVTYHPENIPTKINIKNFKEILKALKLFKDMKIIFTKSNVDKDGNKINSMIIDYVKKNRNNSYFFSSIGYQNYLSILKISDVCLGNSSSGLLEAPTFKKPTINIGYRQLDRLKATSVIDTIPEYKNIYQNINKAMNSKFQKVVKKTVNPYGNGGASLRTYRIIKKINLKDTKIKKFFNFK